MGSCISLPEQPKTDSEQSVSNISNKKVNRFHYGNQVTGPSANYNNARKAKVLKRPKKIHKGLIGLPSNFQHTGHIGITELRSGKVDPEKIKSAMTEVAGSLTIESNSVKQVSSIIESEGQDSSSISSNSPTLQIKRKPTISSTESQKISSTLQPISDPMAEIVEALKMPVDGKF
ncbi:hypothetical protein Glove_30g38 [Diversispora epigaea]|uniref:CRIB domain-containing protein n=1 Tax=Diversispora epigaea TaxID=1348612 RepID=A0A397JHD7_9GLOM|nr:hypothetical protein Glove_30g38 [Diversispora epigaea]